MFNRLLLALVSLLPACAPPASDARQAWLQGTLLADNRLIIQRFPVEARGKFAQMATTPHDFLRGTLGQFMRDVLQPGPWHWPTRFGSAAASRRLLLGDAHLENVGTFHAGAVRLLVDFNDFDSATFGPYHLDVWRLCLSIGVALPEAPAALRTRWMRAAARAYADAIAALARGEPPELADAPAERVLADLLRRALADGAAGSDLARYTRIRSGQRVIFIGDLEPPSAAGVVDRLVPVSPAERVAVRQAFAAWPASLAQPEAAAPAIKDLTRRLGVGVSSYALPRYYLLLEGPTKGLGDDVLVEVKEAADAVELPGVAQYPQPRSASNGARVVVLQRQLQAYLDDDPLLGVATLPPVSYRVRGRDGFQKNLSVARLRSKYADGTWTAADLELAFAAIGRQLARAHGGAMGSDGLLGAPVIAAAIDGAGAAFADEAADFALAYADVVLDDYARFLALVQTEGPLLGDALEADTW